MNVSNVDGKYIWEYQSGTEYVLLISGWSKDGRYLYFDTSPSQGKWYFYEEAYSFSRMDLTNGEFEVLLNAEEDTNGFANPFNSISLSPNEKLIVYLAVSYQEKVVIRNLETGEEKQAHLDYADGGHFSWTSDSLKVAFVVCYNNPDYLYPIHEEVKLLDVETMSITTLLTADRGNVFHLGGWNEDNTILYLGINMVFDTKTGKLMTEIPISTPTREP